MKRIWLQEIRKKQQLTQADVALRVNISRVFYTQIEIGQRRPSAEIAQKIALTLEFEKHGKHWSDLLIKGHLSA